MRRDDMATLQRELQDAMERRIKDLEHKVRTIELCVDGLNTKGYQQKKNTQLALDNIKKHCREALRK